MRGNSITILPMLIVRGDSRAMTEVPCESVDRICINAQLVKSGIAERAAPREE